MAVPRASLRRERHPVNKENKGFITHILKFSRGNIAAAREARAPTVDDHRQETTHVGGKRCAAQIPTGQAAAASSVVMLQSVSVLLRHWANRRSSCRRQRQRQRVNQYSWCYNEAENRNPKERIRNACFWVGSGWDTHIHAPMNIYVRA